MNFLRIFGKNTLIVKMTKKAVSKEMEKHQNLENPSWQQLRQELGGPVTLPHENRFGSASTPSALSTQPKTQ